MTMTIQQAQERKQLLISAAQRGLTARFISGFFHVHGRELTQDEFAALLAERPTQPQPQRQAQAQARPERRTSGLITCPRCSGSGRIPQHSHVEAGVCFACRGDGKVSRAGADRYLAKLIRSDLA